MYMYHALIFEKPIIPFFSPTDPLHYSRHPVTRGHVHV